VRILLDTCTFLWMGIDSLELSGRARAALTEPANVLLLSSVSAWEISAKHALGRLPLPAAPAEYIPAKRRQFGVEPLPFDEAAALCLGRLPALHKDPFDRMLVCQAVMGGLTILTPDEAIRRYAVRTEW
jgi:PIN domain nuclease of toxin-antitoxin system